jgi:hypothetical protein
LSNGSLRDKTREIIKGLRDAYRFEVDPYNADSAPVYIDTPTEDVPEGTVWIQVSHTLANEWAQTLEDLLDATDR